MNQHKLLSIGFSGKRHHTNLEQTRPLLAELFDLLEKKFPSCHMQLLSGLADGADQIVSEVFIGSNPAHSGRMLGAVIPFPLPEYIRTITDIDRFDLLYNQCNYKLHLDGSFGGNVPGNPERKEAYRQQARILPRLCDIFIAVAEKEEDGKKGGTIEAVLAALVLEKPVILLDPSDLCFYYYRSMNEWLFDPGIALPVAAIADKCTVLRQKDTAATGEAVTKDFFFVLRKRIWRGYERLFHKKTKGGDAGEETEEADNSLFLRIGEERRKASEYSKYFMFQYRGGYLLNYCLAVAAIFIAVMSSTVDIFKLEHLITVPMLPEHSILTLDILKVGIIVLIIINTKKITSLHYNARAIKFRYSAERLRISGYFSLLGILRVPRPFVGNHVNEHLRGYTGEAMFRKVMNEMIINTRLTIDITRGYLLETGRFIRKNWLEGQLSYYEKDLKKMKQMDRKLEVIPERLSKIVLIIVVVEIIENLLPDEVHQHPAVSLLILWIIPVLLAATILLPGVITTMNSMHFQTESKRLAFRNEIMLTQLTRIIEELDGELKNIENQPGGNNLLKILTILDQAAGLTTDEVAEWTMIYEKPVWEV